MTPPASPLPIYAGRVGRFAAERAVHAARSRRVSAWRLVTFVLGVAALFWWVWPGLGGGALAASIFGALAVAFVALVAYHERVETALAWVGLLEQINLEAAARYRREWDAIPSPAEPFAEDHPYADLGVAGAASLLHLLGGTCSIHGQTTLAAWLGAPAEPGVIAPRQSAVARLAPQLEFRDVLQAHARELAGVSASQVSRLLRWSESEPWFTRARSRVAAVRAVPAATIVLAAGKLTGAVAGHWWLLPVLAGWLLTSRWGKRTEESIGGAFPGSDLFRRYPPLLAHAESAPPGAPYLERLRERLGNGAAHQQLDGLRRLVDLSNVRYSTLGHFFAQSFLLWDFQVLIALERWQVRSGKRVRDWLAAVGELEALSALAILPHDHPAWCFPTVQPAAAELRATELAHPLLPADVAVGNDVTVGPAGRVLLVTGSNMSGKSTLLRAVGVNVVLAQAGAPACAASLTLPPLQPWSAIRIEDSLAQGISYFMAELLRLKTIVDAARLGGRDSRPGVLFLLDEMLQGTNTAERRVAASRVIAELLATGAVGVVTTHDLALADEPGVQASADLVHFRETVVEEGDGGRMEFDYKLRPGLATSVNALRLLRMVGL